MADRTQTLWVNFYAKGNGSIHFTRETADQSSAFMGEANPRLACRPVSAAIGEGLTGGILADPVPASAPDN